MHDKFDENNCALIGAFLNLKEQCYFFEKYFLGEDFFNANSNGFNFLFYRSFYSDFRDVCDLPLFFLINEEISNKHERDYLPALMMQVFEDGNFTTNFREEDKSHLKTRHFKDVVRLVTEQYNEIIGSAMLDFTVSSFSVFEYWLDKFYDKSCHDHKNEILRSRAEKISDQLKKYAKSADEHSAEIISGKILSIPGKFISLPDKINGISTLIDQNIYKRNLRNDKDIIDFLSKKRNSVHNLGEHRGQDMTITVDGVEHSLSTGKPAFSTSWLNSLGLIGHLIKIYTELLSSIPNRSDFIDGFIEMKVDGLAIELLTITINDFLAQHGPKAEWATSKGDFAAFLIRKFSFSDKQSEVFIENTLNLGVENLSSLDTISLLAMPNPK
jgi:hypothetical protein